MKTASLSAAPTPAAVIIDPGDEVTGLLAFVELRGRRSVTSC